MSQYTTFSSELPASEIDEIEENEGPIEVVAFVDSDPRDPTGEGYMYEWKFFGYGGCIHIEEVDGFRTFQAAEQEAETRISELTDGDYKREN